MQTLEKPRLPGIQSPPPDREAYAFGAPEGVWTARLDYLQWGRKANNVPNLLCYFTDVATGKRYFFSAFKSDGYGPLDRSLSFRQERLGTLYRLTTGRNSRGNPVWRAAVRLESADESPAGAC